MAYVKSIPDPVSAASKERLSELARAFPPSAKVQPAFPIMASAAQQYPYWLQVVLDAASWKVFLGLPAAAFLGQLGKNAADDVWKNKARIGEILREKAYAALSDIAFAIKVANEHDGRMGVHVGLPGPTPHYAAHASLAFRSPEEISVNLARFVVASEKIEAAIQASAETYRVLGDVNIDTRPDAPLTVSWLSPAPKGMVRLALDSLDGDFTEE